MFLIVCNACYFDLFVLDCFGCLVVCVRLRWVLDVLVCNDYGCALYREFCLYYVFVLIISCQVLRLLVSA